MKNMRKSVMVMATFCVAMWLSTVNTKAADSYPQVSLQRFVILASTSPSNSIAQQNVMSFVDKGGVVGLIPTDIGNNASALNMPCTMRACDIIYSIANLFIWDATNVTAGPFAEQNGKREAWVYDRKDINTFLVTDIWFRLDSSDAAHSLMYTGNAGTNTADNTPQVFSPTLRGERWNTDGTVTTYYSGESVLGRPVNRVIAMVRLGWKCNNMTDVVNDLNYFRSQMTLRHTATFYTSVSGVTNTITSQPCLAIDHGPAGTNAIISLQGQRQIPIFYGLERRLILNDENYPWVVLFDNGLSDGFQYASTPSNTDSSRTAFYRAFQASSTGNASPHGMVLPSAPIATVSNGPE